MSNPYDWALEKAKDELKDLDIQINTLNIKKTNLEAVIRNLSALTGKNTATSNEVYTSEPLATRFLWEQIAIVMKSNPAFTITHAASAVEMATGKSLGNTRSQQIRNSLIRRTDVFAQNVDGTWRVIKELQ